MGSSPTYDQWSFSPVAIYLEIVFMVALRLNLFKFLCKKFYFYIFWFLNVELYPHWEDNYSTGNSKLQDKSYIIAYILLVIE